MIAALRKSPILKCFLLGLMLVLLIWTTAGQVLSLGWHLLHHDHFEYEGLAIKVPSHSYVTPSSNHIDSTISFPASTESQ
jgi:hypothetical protein